MMPAIFFSQKMQKENFSRNKACRHRKAKMYRKNKEDQHE
jgi:hypothetical protein